MKIAETISNLKQFRNSLGSCVGLVPTMGGIHEGHLALIKEAKRDNDAVIASVFLNPKQFNEAFDLEVYPRDLARDLQLLQDARVDVVFLPNFQEIYPHHFQTYVDVDNLSRCWEGAARPGHFRAVTTIVAILLNLTQPQHIYFGQKDVQQVVIIGQMVRDLRIPTEMVVIPTVRSHDGLALSTRNNLLNSEERKTATRIFYSLSKVLEAYESEVRDANELRDILRKLISNCKSIHLDYAEIVNINDLSQFQGKLSDDDVALIQVAARIGNVRLIDNSLIPKHRNNRDDLSTLLGINARYKQ